MSLPGVGTPEWAWQEHSNGDWTSQFTNLIARSEPQGYEVVSLAPGIGINRVDVTVHSGRMGLAEALRFAERLSVTREEVERRLEAKRRKATNVTGINSCVTCPLNGADMSDCANDLCKSAVSTVRPICPLPRIGSKEWGWHRVDSGVYESTMTSLMVIVFDDEYCEISRGIDDEDNVVRINASASSAKRIAELLARRDWRRENKAKAAGLRSK